MASMPYDHDAYRASVTYEGVAVVPPPEGFTPPHKYAEINIMRHVYPRVGPGEEYPFVQGSRGVYGVVEVVYRLMSLQPEWVLIRQTHVTPADPVEGYLKAKYITYLPDGPLSAEYSQRAPPPKSEYFERRTAARQKPAPRELSPSSPRRARLPW